VIFLEPKLIYRAFRGEVPEEPYTVPIGEAVTRREGAATWRCSPTAP